MRIVVSLGLAALVVVPIFAAPPRIDPAGIPNELIVCGTAVPDDAVARFLAVAGEKSRVVVLTAGKETVSARLKEAAQKADVAVEVRPLRAADDGSLPDVSRAKGVWLAGDDAAAMRRILVGSPLEKSLKGIPVVAASGPVAPLLARGRPDSKFAGCDLFPDAVFSVGEKAVVPGDNLVGYHVAGDAALNLRGRTMRVLGSGKVTIRVAGGKAALPREISLSGKTPEDLTALRRSARDNASGFPVGKPGEPVVEKGTLVIIGGGGMPAGMIGRFVELAGGKKAKIVVLPTAMPDPLPKRDGIAEAFKKAGAEKVTVLSGRTVKEVESKEYLDAMSEATGVWFGGGRQWRFVDAYEDTKLVPLMFDVLKRGGVIGGSSAGATIQGEYLARGGVFDNFAERYRGYERGLNFLPGVAIDQHFAQRDRFADMAGLMKELPSFLGIGLDEATAIVVTGSKAEVTGRGGVHFFDASKKGYVTLKAGESYDLKGRKVVK